MTDSGNPTGINTQEVSLYDEDGGVINSANPLPSHDTLLQTSLETHSPLDVETGLPGVILEEHYLLHAGKVFLAFSEQLTLGITTVKFSLDVPAGVDAHLVVAVDVHDGVAIVRIFEDATYTGGTALPAYNRDRDSLNTAESTMKSGVTTTNGTQIDAMMAGGGQGRVGVNRGAIEWDLKDDATYRIDVEGLDALTDAVIRFGLYEL